MFTFEVPFERLFAPTSQIQMSKILEIQKPWEKVMERSGLRIEEKILKKGVKSVHKKSFISANLGLLNH